MSEIKNKNIKWWISVSSFVFLFSFILVFAYAKMSFIFKGVSVEAEIIKNENPLLTEVVGNAKNAIYISLNGREIFIDREGNFSESISLLPGYEVITILAKDKFGNTSLKKFHVVGDDAIEKIAFKDKETNTTQITNEDE